MPSLLFKVLEQKKNPLTHLRAVYILFQLGFLVSFLPKCPPEVQQEAIFFNVMQLTTFKTSLLPPCRVVSSKL